MCGAEVKKIQYEGRDRHVCTECGFVIYVNPLPATTLVVIDTNRVLLTLRGVEPNRGEWCLPGGFLEWGETPEEGAKRELFEETGLNAESLTFVGIYNSMIYYHALLLGYIVERWSGKLTCGDDAEEAEWFSLESLPPLAFESHKKLLLDVLKKM